MGPAKRSGLGCAQPYPLYKERIRLRKRPSSRAYAASLIHFTYDSFRDAARDVSGRKKGKETEPRSSSDRSGRSESPDQLHNHLQHRPRVEDG